MYYRKIFTMYAQMDYLLEYAFIVTADVEKAEIHQRENNLTKQINFF